MIYKARHDSVPVIDASDAVTVVHQNHDYGHLPGGEPHYRHPESTRNIELAGGYEMMFRLRDADWKISPEGIRKKWAKDWEPIRRIEADLISYFGPGLTSKTIHMLFHPSNAFSYLRYKLLGPDGDNASGPSNSGASR
jgi:hypothetical protein